MNYHMGLLGGPTANNLKWIKSANWYCLPDEIRYDLEVCLMTPGFSFSYWVHVTGVSRPTINRYIETISPSLRDVAIENWNSVSAEDARLLSNLSPARSRMPVVCGLQMANEIRNGLTISKAAKAYGVTYTTAEKWMNQPFGGPDRLPDWFRSLIPSI